ncbi:MAG: FAD:protein FMN transferase [Opitutales bacterium]
MRLLAKICGVLLASQGQSHAELERLVFVEKLMGADFRIVVYAKEEKLARAAVTAAFEEVQRLNDILSDYEAESELSQLSETSGSGKIVPISEDLWTVLSAAQNLSKQTEGAFDVTVGPCVRLWRIARFRKTMPDPEKLEQVRKAMGFRHLKLFPNRRSARLGVANMILDLGGIAKGYAADRALAILRNRGIGSALVDAGGDLALGDPPPGRKGWRIEIGGRKHPDLPIPELANCAVATSGDVEQFVEVDGKRYSHIIEPRTGIGLTTQLQVTVVAKSGMQADSLASALTVLGPNKGSALVKTLPGVQAYFVQRLGDATTLTRAKGK